MQVTEAIQEARDVLQALETLQPEGKSTQAEIIESRNRLADLTAHMVVCIRIGDTFTLHGVSEEVTSFVHGLGLHYDSGVEIKRYTANEEIMLYAHLTDYIQFSIRDGVGVKRYGVKVLANFMEAENWRKVMTSMV